MHGFGPVEVEPNEPLFHADWERRVFGMLLAIGVWGRWNLDMSRFVKGANATGGVSGQ
jgi:nitrile hydratase